MFSTAFMVIAFTSATHMAADKELKALEGTWVIEAATLAARDHKMDFETMKLTITGDKYTIELGDNREEGTITVDASHEPKWIDLTTKPGGFFKGRTLPGIYTIEKGKLVICCNSEKPDRPTAFDAKEKTPFMLFTFVHPAK